MSIKHRILGAAGHDNALHVEVDTGQSVERLLFDCGEGCVTELPFADILATDHLFFSHLHIDHVAGFDSWFRCLFNRTTKPNRIWGPPGTAVTLQHRFQGFLWNLHDEMSGSWHVSDIHPQQICTHRFELGEAFAIAHEEKAAPQLLEGVGYTIEVLTMDHRTPSLAYVVREKPRSNLDMSRLTSLGLRPGPWVKQLKDNSAFPDTLIIDGVSHSTAELRKALLVETPGDSIAYFTDFLLDDVAMERLIPALHGCRVLICEGQYRHADIDLARKNYHMTTVLSATLASRAGVQELVLFHLSDRYNRDEWLQMLHEARQIFPNTSYPAHWGL